MPTLIGIATHGVSKAPMEVATSADVVFGQGIAGDRPRKKRERQVTILSLRSWREACSAAGCGGQPWTVRRANLLVTGKTFGPDDVGKKLCFGDVILIITGECDPCPRMDAQMPEPGLTAALEPEWRGGVCAAVLAGGPINIGMEFTLE